MHTILPIPPSPTLSSYKEVGDYLGGLCKKVAGIKEEVSPIEWILALPLYHFLKEQSEPFGGPDISVMWEREQSLGLKSVQYKATSLDK